VIHTVGPVWKGGSANEDALLASCYSSCFAQAQAHVVKTIAFPAISTGVYRFPLERATRIAVRETQAFLQANRTVEKVIFACFGNSVYQCYKRVVEEVIRE
jgi:O-acetyl-ADP-ribose deacetylase (regulator of RNase III)